MNYLSLLSMFGHSLNNRLLGVNRVGGHNELLHAVVIIDFLGLSCHIVYLCQSVMPSMQQQTEAIEAVLKPTKIDGSRLCCVKIAQFNTDCLQLSLLVASIESVCQKS